MLSFAFNLANKTFPIALCERGGLLIKHQRVAKMEDDVEKKNDFSIYKSKINNKISVLLDKKLDKFHTNRLLINSMEFFKNF